MTSTPAEVAPADSARVRSLDGLRGVAALVVVAHHALQVDPTFAAVQAAESAAGRGGAVWALTHTPLHLLWAGEEAVLVFFVLSGFVLTLPATRGAVRWREYYPRRLVRLYVPVWGSLLLAVALKALLAPGPATAGERSPWLAERVSVPLGEVWHDGALVAGTGLLNSPLWSLRWEVLFSLALPLYLLTLRRRGGLRAWLDVGAMVALIGVGTVIGSPWLRYLPVFGLGVVLAFHHDRLAALTARVDAVRRPGPLWVALGVGVATLLTARWVVAGLPFRHRALDALASGATILGAAAAVVLALRWGACCHVLERRTSQWLGARSFSLYLVHEPVVVAVAVLLPLTWGTWPAAATGAVLALAVSAVFFRLVERPSIALARHVGRRAGGRARARVPAAAGPAPTRRDDWERHGRAAA